MLENSKFEREIDEILGKTCAYDSINTGASKNRANKNTEGIRDVLGHSPETQP
jgi:hypothetical protein